MPRAKTRRPFVDDTPPELRWPLGPLATGVVLFGVALLTLLALTFPDGALSWWLNALLRGGLGDAAYLTPLLLVGLGMAAWRPRRIPPERLRRAAIASWLAGLAALAALLQPLAGRPPPAWNGGGGGLIGWALHAGLESLLGPASATVVLAPTLLAALCVAAGVGPRDFLRAARGSIGWVRRRLRRPPGPELTISTGLKKVERPRLQLRLPRLRREEFGQATPAAPAADPATGAPAAPPAPEGERRWQLPPLTLLNPGGRGELTQVDIEKKAKAIEEALADFDVYARVVEVNPGPTVTQFGLRPGYRERRDRHGNVVRRDKIKVSEIVALHNDLALALAAPSIRIEAPVPGRQLVGIEVPNGATGMVALRDMLESERFGRMSVRTKLAVALGQDVSSNVVAADLGKMPHLLIAGATGAGKSVCVNAIIVSLLLHATPDELRLLMIDPKRVELTGYNDVPHLLRPVVTEVDTVVSVLRWVTHEMDERYKRLEQLGCRNVDGYNRVRASRPELPSMPYLVVIIDEMADIMLLAAEEVEPALCRLAQMARAVGIHLIVATQRPSVDVITGLIKANFPTRIAFAVTSQVDSRTIIDGVGAEKLLGRGDMLFLAGDAPKPLRLQGTWVDEAEIEAVVQHWQEQGQPEYVDDLVNVQAWSGDGDEDVELYERAVEVTRQHSRVSTSLLQRRLRIGYPRAARLIEVLEERGVVGPSDGGKSREVLLRDATDDAGYQLPVAGYQSPAATDSR
ncbi:MAG TPA: DNA translocase FtsK [Chloroflexota bacterium]|jgi:S-DNA-T family DNA segregation ATPase FtsK/SpoIIIE